MESKWKKEHFVSLEERGRTWGRQESRSWRRNLFWFSLHLNSTSFLYIPGSVGFQKNMGMGLKLEGNRAPTARVTGKLSLKKSSGRRQEVAHENRAEWGPQTERISVKGNCRAMAKDPPDLRTITFFFLFALWHYEWPWKKAHPERKACRLGPTYML